MWCRKNDVPGGSRALTSLENGKNRRQPVHRRLADLAIRIRVIDCMLDDIQAEIELLQRERSHLGGVRGELAGMRAKWGCT